jgi:tRNA-2-methylthio-N6-dimethylallyladenosine synthase
MGRTDNNRIVNFPSGPQSGRLVGTMLDVRVTHAYPHSLRGSAVRDDEVGKADPE